MSHNGVMKELIKRYGKRCFIDVLHLRKDTNRKYTGKSNYYTYHHIKRRSEGGQTTLKNGALLSRENHEWLHQQSPEAIRCINDLFHKYKNRVDESRKKGDLTIDEAGCPVVYVDDLKLPHDIVLKPLEFSIDKKRKKSRNAPNGDQR